MYIVMAAAECASVAKAGGLGDVVFGLSRESEICGNAVEIVLPKYARMRYGEIWGLRVSYHDLWVPWGGGAARCTVWFGFVHGRKCFFIEPHSSESFFGRDRLYGYGDDVDRFAFFSKAALEFLLQAGKRPDVSWTPAGSATRPPSERDGYVFHQADNPAIESALHRALGRRYGYPRDLRQLIANAMRADYSWARPGQDYLNIYNHIRPARAGAALPPGQGPAAGGSGTQLMPEGRAALATFARPAGEEGTVQRGA